MISSHELRALFCDQRVDHVRLDQLMGLTQDDLVTVSRWDALYFNRMLETCADVKPRSPDDTILQLIIALFKPYDRNTIYCLASAMVDPSRASPGARLSQFASTHLFDPDVHGRTVTAGIYGLISVGQTGSRVFKFYKDFEI